MTNNEEGLLDDLLAIESGLTGWDMDFLGSLDAEWRERKLTEKQRDKLHEIARKVDLEA